MSKDMLRLKERIPRYLSRNFQDFKLKLKKEFTKAIESRYRLMVMLAGDDSEKQGVLCVDIVISYLRWFLGKKNIKILYIYHDEFEDAEYRRRVFERLVRRYIKRHKLENSVDLEIAVYEGCERFLGTTYQLLILDLVNSLKPNDVGRLVNIVEGGGIVIAFTPKWSEWPDRKNLFQMSLAVPQHPKPRNVFVRWFQTVTMISKGIYVYDVDSDNVIKFDELNLEKSVHKPISIPNNTKFPQELYKLALTQDQIEAIKIIEELVEQPKNPYKRAAIVLTADRGRGKSCAIGIGIVGLIQCLLEFRNRVRIAITAPELSNVQALMMLARKALNTIGLDYKVIERDGMVMEIKGDRFSIEYWNPAVVIKQDADIVAVDEAAGIPVPLLHKIWRKFRRTIFATTIHGYEGAGRGFSIRFLKKLKEDKLTKLIIYEMEEPIRYSVNDPVEKWVFRVLLLDAEPDEVTEEDMRYVERKEFVYLILDPEKLFMLENENMLRKLFGIYVLAHYRNEPDDLGMIADAPHHSVRGLALPNGKIVAAAQLAEEGPIPNEYLDSLLRGGKIPGNIIPDRLLKHGRLRDIASGKGWRIVRIAVHPDIQGRGIGSYLLSMLVKESIERGYDWIGSGFGATEELLRFWLKNGFVPVHISPDRNPVSAEYTVLVIKPLDNKWKDIVNVLYNEFKTRLLESLYDTYRDLEVEVAYLLLNADAFVDLGTSTTDLCSKVDMTPIQLDRLLSYIEGFMTYESCNDVILKIIKHYWLQPKNCRKLDKLKELVSIVKVLQGVSWELSAEILHVTRGKVIDIVRDIVEVLIEQFLGIKREELDKHLGRVTLDQYL